MLTWWLWVDRSSGNWLIAPAGESIPKHQAKHVKFKVDSETFTFERPQGPRWVIVAAGALHIEEKTITIMNELETRLTALEQVAHLPVVPNDVAKLARRVDELEVALGRRKEAT